MQRYALKMINYICVVKIVQYNRNVWSVNRLLEGQFIILIS